MRILSLEVDCFRAIQSGRLSFGPGLNIVHGPNDHGKSTLTEAIRAVLLVAPGSAEARSFSTWGAAAGQFPKAAITFECEGATWRLEKIFAPGSRAKASLEKSTDGGTRYQLQAQGRDVEGKLSDLLQWGLAAPGGRGVTPRTETFLTTALLGKQGEVDSIFEASFKSDQNESGKTLVTHALDALGQEPRVTKLLKRLKERTDKVYRGDGVLKRSADSPIVQAQVGLKKLEEQVRGFEDETRKSTEVEQQVVQLSQAREQALEARDQARAHLDELRMHQASAAQQEQLERTVTQHLREFERMTTGMNAIEGSRREALTAQGDLALAADQQIQAIEASKVADDQALAARERLARARSGHESSQELAASARDVRLADLRVLMEKNAARKTTAHTVLAAVTELASLEAEFAAATNALDGAKEEVAHSAAELKLALMLQELQDARVLTVAFDAALSDQKQLIGRESTATAAVADADAELKAANAALERARELDHQARSADDERRMNIGILDTRILRSESEIRDSRDVVGRAKAALLQIGRAEKAQGAASAADAIAAEIEARLAGNAEEIAECDAELRRLESIALELRRGALAVKVDELSRQESDARESRLRAVEMRDRATLLETETSGVRFPSSQQVASIESLQAAIESRKLVGPGAYSGSATTSLLASIFAAAIGFGVARFVGSAAIALSICAALALGLAVGMIVALGSNRRRRNGVESSWRIETERLLSRLAAETASVLREAGVSSLEQVEPKRHKCQERRSDAERLRQEAAGLDRQADAMLNSSAGLSSLQRELATLVEQLSVNGQAVTAPSSDSLAGGLEELRDRQIRGRESLENAQRARNALQTQVVRQMVVCASARAQAENAMAELHMALSPGVNPQEAVLEGDARLREAESRLDELRRVLPARVRR